MGTSLKMKLLIALAVLACATYAINVDFESYLSAYNKQYSSAEEFEYRKGIFQLNQQKVNWINSVDNDAEYGLTEFADMSEEEFAFTYLGTRPYAFLFEGMRSANPINTTGAPESFDWREEGAVTPVKNQGSCGSCWAFSTTGDVEGKWFLAKGELVSLSEQQLVDCDLDGEDQGCSGGLMSSAMSYISQAGGLDSEAAYKYHGRRGSCSFEKSSVAATITGWESVSQDEDEIAAYLAKNGPLSIAINASWLQFYLGGISNPLWCSPKGLNHGVLLVGYGEEKGKKYWIIKNSWGTGWGEKGYFRIVRGVGKCGVNTMVTSAIV
eukprot:JP446398.1.p2 GENE.JP446398.1~~JP446398.1.p2  ORF type:complete len:324 (-),score=153.12 JP446398.1:168-1139(-)